MAIAFKPVSKTLLTSLDTTKIEKVDNAELYNYKDKGVEYQGYSKTRLGNNQFKLLRQEPKNAQTIFVWTASNVSLTLSINPAHAEQDFFITNLIIESVTDTDCFFLVAEVGGNLICLPIAKSGTNNNWNVKFEPPLKFEHQTIEIQPLNLATGAPVAITGTAILNYYGYLEQKS